MPLECFGRDGLLDGNRTHISRLGGACTIHYATRRSGRILARRGAQPPVLWTTTTIKRLWLVLLVLFGMKVALADEVPAVDRLAPGFSLADQTARSFRSTDCAVSGWYFIFIRRTIRRAWPTPASPESIICHFRSSPTVTARWPGATALFPTGRSRVLPAVTPS